MVVAVDNLIFDLLSSMTVLIMTNLKCVHLNTTTCMHLVHFQRRSVEDLKEHYYSVCNRLNKVCFLCESLNCDNVIHTQARAAREMGGATAELVAYDAEHERKRKLQLERLYNRTHEQVDASCDPIIVIT